MSPWRSATLPFRDRGLNDSEKLFRARNAPSFPTPKLGLVTGIGVVAVMSSPVLTTRSVIDMVVTGFFARACFLVPT